MTLFFVSVLALIVVLGIMIVVHEFGHFAAAKFFGVRVEVFSVGFGKRLFGVRRGDTDYRVSLLPLGGYVKMSGENPMEARSGDSGEFMSHPRWQRFIIAVAGPGMNILLAVALLAGVYMVRNEIPAYLEQPATIGWVLDNSPADKAGIQPGDRIVSIDNTQNPTWRQVEDQVLLSPGQPVIVGLQRGSDFLSKTVVPTNTGPDDMGANPGWLPPNPVKVATLEPSYPAAQAGIKPGDDIVGVNGQPLRNVQQLIADLQKTKDQPVQLAIVRDGQQMAFTITPKLSEAGGEKQYRLGFTSQMPMKIEKLGFAAAVQKSVVENRRLSGLVFELLGRMAQRKVSMRQLDGPISIAKVSGEAAMAPGWTPIVSLTSAISLQLGLFNLLPFPILDGGLILMLLIEALMRRDISLKIKERIYQVAFLLLVLFAVAVIFNDLTKTVPGLSKYLGTFLR